MARERVLRALALAWCLAAAATRIAAIAHPPYTLMEASQVQFLQDWNTGWNANFDWDQRLIPNRDDRYNVCGVTSPHLQSGYSHSTTPTLEYLRIVFEIFWDKTWTPTSVPS
ncbi:unnamed protein product [Closterium sp. NIES-54]